MLEAIEAAHKPTKEKSEIHTTPDPEGTAQDQQCQRRFRPISPTRQRSTCPFYQMLIEKGLH
jgi:hypothetical protein